MLELAYSIDKTNSEGCFCIRIETIEREGSKVQFVKPNPPLTSQGLGKLANEKDKLLMPLLMRCKIESASPYLLVKIPYQESYHALKFLAGTGKLFLNGKQLVVDLFSKIEFFYQLKEGSLKGKLALNGSRIDLSDCDFVSAGPPHFFIKGILLKLIGSDVTWKQLKKAFDPKASYSEKEIEEILEDAEENKEAPKVIDEDHSRLKLAIEKDPIPQLILKDRLGAFADLMMDYGSGMIVSFHDPSSKPSLKRKIDSEKGWEKDLLETDFVRKQMPNSHYYCPIDKVVKSLSFLLELGWTIRDCFGNRLVRYTESRLEMTQNASRIFVKGHLEYEGFEADISKVAGAFNRKERFLQLGEGAIGLLDDRMENSAVKQLAEDGEIIGNSLGIKNSRLNLLNDLIDENPNTKLDESIQEIREKLKSFEGIALQHPGKDFLGHLRPYQQQGLSWLYFLYQYGFHGLLADDMGLGKTVQVLALLSLIEKNLPVLIVVPSSLIFNWQREIGRFLKNRNVTVLQGSKEAALQTADIILASYATLRLQIPFLSSIEYRAVILDEAQNIKNSETQTAGAAYRLKAKFRLSITGTPIENNFNELWSQFHFLMPDLLGSKPDFEAQLIALQADERYLKKIKKQIKPFVLRRKKEEVAKDLPERIEQTVWIEMPPKQREIYDAFLSGVKGNLFKKVEVDGVSKHRMEILEAILRLRQICCHPLLVSGQLDASETLQSAKFDILLSDLEILMEEGKKALIYSQFTSMLHLLSKHFNEKGWKFAYLDGTTANREAPVDQFQNDPSIPFFLISLKAGGMGLNLTQADYVYLYDPWWNDAVENQAISRSHRIGRSDTVIAKRLVVAESIEEKMMKLKSLKQAMLSDLMEFDDVTAGKSLTADDLMFLLG